MIITVISIYLLIVLAIGLGSHRLFRGTGEDYFLASRSIGPFVLLMSLFGTNMTAFSILGASGEAYRIGIGVFGLMASSSAIVIPLVFYFVGIPLWGLGKKHGYLTQIQYFRDRWGSDLAGSLLFVVLAALMIPYLLIGVMGGGITLANITNGEIPSWVGSLLVCLVIFIYITFGGMRGTAWVNTFQTMVFMVLGAAAFWVVLNRLDGLSNALATVAAEKPQLMVRGSAISPLKFLSYTLIPLSAGMFPHMFMHWLSARSQATFKIPIIFYPICMIIVWVPSVLLGVMGQVDFSGLQGAQASSVMVMMVAKYAPGVLGGLLAAGVVAAIMSSLDSQTLSLSTMFTQDIVKHYAGNRGEGQKSRREITEAGEIRFGRIFVLIILGITFWLSLLSSRSIFSLAIWSFSGFSGLFPIAVAALYWKRSNATGAIAAIITVAIVWLYLFMEGWQIAGYTVAGSGLMPVAVMVIGGGVAMVVGSLLGRPVSNERLAKFFPE